MDSQRVGAVMTHGSLRSQGAGCTREQVRDVLRMMDPDAVEVRGRETINTTGNLSGYRLCKRVEVAESELWPLQYLLYLTSRICRAMFSAGAGSRDYPTLNNQVRK